jgi:hypothetical protein
LRKFSACFVWSAIDQPRDLGPEQLLDIVERRERILDRIVQQAGDDRGTVELHAREDAGDRDGMREIRIARGAQLRAMRFRREDISAVQRVFIDIRIVGFDALDQLELAHDRGTRFGRASRRRSGGAS